MINISTFLRYGTRKSQTSTLLFTLFSLLLIFPYLGFAQSPHNSSTQNVILNTSAANTNSAHARSPQSEDNINSNSQGIPSSPSPSKPRIILRGDSWCPYNCDPKSGVEGYVVDIIRAIFSDVYDIDYQIITWNRALSEVKTGKADILLSSTLLEGPEFIYPSKKIGLNFNRLFALKKMNPLITHSDQLKNLKVGIVSGYKYGPVADELIRKKLPNFVPFYGDEAQSKMLKTMLAGRIDMILEDPQVMTHVVLMNNYEKDILNEVGYFDKSPIDIGIAFGKNNPRSKILIQDFEIGLENLRSKGELKKILEKYHVNDWQSSKSSNN